MQRDYIKNPQGKILEFVETDSQGNELTFVVYTYERGIYFPLSFFFKKKQYSLKICNISLLK